MVLQHMHASRVGAEVRPPSGLYLCSVAKQSALGPWCEVGLPSLCLSVTLPGPAAPGLHSVPGTARGQLSSPLASRM